MRLRYTNNFYPRFSKEEYHNRYEKLRQDMKKENLDCLIIYNTHTYFGTDPGQSNVIYLSAYAAFHHTYIVFPQTGEPTLFHWLDVHVHNARQMSVIEDIRVGSAAEVADRIIELGCDRANIGMVGYSWGGVDCTVSVEDWNIISKKLPRANFRTVTRWYKKRKEVLSKEEIKFVKKGADLTDAAYKALIKAIKPGKTTDSQLHDVALATVHSMGGRIPFGHVESTSMSSPKTYYPNPYPLNRTINKGDVILTEIAAAWGGYMGKIWGTIFVGKPNKLFQELFDLAQDCYRGTVKAIKPGLKGKDVQPALAGKTLDAGFDALSMIGGWSMYNTDPDIGLPGKYNHNPEHSEYEFRPGHALSVVGWPVDNNLKYGMWLGDSCLVTKTGCKPLHEDFRVDEMVVV